MRTWRWCVPGILSVLAAGSLRAEDFSSAAGVSGGFCVHLGCGDGARTAGIASTGRFVVHGWEKDPARVEAARKTLLSRGLYGVASVDGGPLDPLPYPDNLADIVVADNLARLLSEGLSLAEVVRVTAPGGAALFGAGLSEGDVKSRLSDAGLKEVSVKKSGGWTVVRKPRPAGMDEWTNYGHDAGGGKVSDDVALTPPSELRWSAGPVLAVYSGGAVSAGGRNFYVVRRQEIPLAPGEGSDAGEKGAGLFLVARDAWNGVPLWKCPIRGGYLAADASRVYVHEGGSVSAFDAATGAPAGSFSGGGPGAILLAEKCLAVVGKTMARVYDTATGRELWKTGVANLTDAAMGDGRFIVCDDGKVIAAFGLASGKPLWRDDAAAWNDGAVQMIYLRRGTLVAVSAREKTCVLRAIQPADGKVLWRREFLEEKKDAKTESYLADGLVWIYDRGAPAWLGLDPATGQEKRKFTTFAPHQYCAPDAATDRFFIRSRPCDFVSWSDGNVTPFRATRTACKIGTFMANGLLYSLPDCCGCVRGEIHGCAAFAPAGIGGPKADPPESPGRLETFAAAAPTASAAALDDWPTFRHDARRSASSASSLPQDLTPLWEAAPCDQKGAPGAFLPDWRGRPEGDDPVSPPVVSGGRAYVALPDLHRVAAFDAATGKPLWSRTLGGRVDTPPTIHEGVCLVGCRDGRVYALSASDGAVLWRFRAAPAEKRVVVFGQTESTWPVVGGVLVEEGVACVAAGRTMDVDGGMWQYGLDPKSGKLLRSGRPEGGGVADILVGKHDGKATDTALRESGRSVGGLLDRTWRWWGDSMDRFHLRSYGGAVGQVIAFSDERVYAYREGKGRANAGRAITARAVGKETQDLWKLDVPSTLEVDALAVAGDALVAALGGGIQAGAKGELWVIDTKEGKKLRTAALAAAPAAEGLAVAEGRIYLSMRDGRLRCFGKR
ncbi:MAG: PQQ-binding-like beta-propeller repeat protein [Planctomycetota bacterium]